MPRWAIALAAAFAAACGLTLALRGARWAVAHLGGTIGPAQWIWVAHDRRQAQQLTFYAARDFRLETPPARARLFALGDQEYILYLNGKRVGAGGWRPGGVRLDQYEVGDLLLPGGNRLLAELRSDHGGGGFLASLVDEASGRMLVGTDGTWRTFKQHRLGLVRGWLPVAAAGGLAGASAAGPGEAAVTWGRPPVGRWGRVVPAWARPTFAELTGGGRPVAAAAETPFDPPPESRVRRDQSMVLFDWGREVTGYLALETGYEPAMDEEPAPPPDRQRTALLWTGDAPPQPVGEDTPPSGEVMMMARAHQWLDARLRRFRYVLVIGIERPLSASVYEVDPRVAAHGGMEIAADPRFPAPGGTEIAAAMAAAAAPSPAGGAVAPRPGRTEVAAGPRAAAPGMAQAAARAGGAAPASPRQAVDSTMPPGGGVGASPAGGAGRARPPRGSARMTQARGNAEPTSPGGSVGARRGDDQGARPHGTVGATPLQGSAGVMPRRGTDGATPLRGSAGATPLHGTDGATPLRGVFGLTPPRLRSPVENEIRRKLESLEGVPGRERL